MIASLFSVAALTLSQDLLVSGYNSNAVHRFDLVSGASQGPLGNGVVSGAQSVRHGPDGNLYAVAEKVAEVHRFDGATGAYLGLFVGDDPLTPGDETGGLQAPTAAAFGPDGALYVADFQGDCVMRYDGQSGAFLGLFVAAGSGGIDGPDAGMVFGPDGDLYVPGFNSNNVVRFDGQSGAPIGDVITAGTGLGRPRALRFRDDGWLYVASWGNNRVLRVPPGGGPFEVFATAFRPTGLVFDPSTGDLLVANDQNDNVQRFAADGAALGTFIAGIGSPVNGATWLAINPDPRLRLGWLQPGAVGATNSLTLSNATPGAPLLLGVSLGAASIPLGGCPNAYLGVASPTLIAIVADAAGESTLSAFLGAELAGITLRFQGFEPLTCRTSWTVVAEL